MSYRTHDYDYLLHPPTLTGKICTATAVALLDVDQEYYVSDDARDGRAAIAPFLAGDPKSFKVTRECWDLADNLTGRSHRHFMFDCDGNWDPPAPDEDQDGGD